MSKHLLGATLLFLLISGGSTIWYFVEPLLDAKKKQETSAIGEAKGTLQIGGDGYAGYFHLNSEEFTNRMLEQGFRIDFQDDGGDYASRSERLNSGELQMAVYTVDAYLLNAAAYNFPGSIVAVLSESQGSDAILADKAAFPSLDDLRDRKDTVIAFTSDSPSHYLLKIVGVHFGLKHLLKDGAWQKPVAGSAEAWKRLKSGEVQVAALWEPEVSLAIADPRFHKLLGTESTSGLIVDVLVVNRDFLKEEAEALSLFMEVYFRSLKHYRRNPEALQDEMAEWASLAPSQAEQLIKGLRWINLHENAYTWFSRQAKQSTSGYRLVKVIESTLDILINAGDFKGNPLLDEDPRSIIYPNTVLDLAAQTDEETPEAITSNFVFNALTPAQWSNLNEVGTLELEPVGFQSGSLELTGKSREDIAAIVEILKQYPSFRVSVEGHTSMQGDSEANRKLSQRRAEAVAEFLLTHFNLPEERVRAIGYGSERPLPRGFQESYRAYLNRLARVEIKFLRDSL